MKAEEKVLWNICKSMLLGKMQDIPADCDMEKLVQLAKINKIYNLVLSVCSTKYPEKYHEAFEKCKFSSKVYDNNLVALASILNSTSKEYVIIKGRPLSIKLYGDKQYLRDMGDVDIIVKEENFLDIYAVLVENGYSSLYDTDNEIDEILSVDMSNHRNYLLWGPYHHEMQLYKEDNYSTFYIELKTGTTGLKSGFKKLFDYSEGIVYNGTKVATLNRDASFLMLMLNSFSNCEGRDILGSQSIRDYYEVVLYLTVNSVNCEAIYELSRSIEVTHNISYVANVVLEAYGELLSMDVTQALTNLAQFESKTPSAEYINYSSDINIPLSTYWLSRMHRGPWESRAFNKDFNYYLYAIAYKASTYSNTNYYITTVNHRVTLGAMYIYKFYDSKCFIPYHFIINDTGLYCVNMRIDKKLYSYMVSGDITIRFSWVNNDILSPSVTRCYDLSMSRRNELLEVKTLETYSTSQYQRIIQEENTHAKNATVMYTESDDTILISICIQEMMLFICNDTALFQISIMKKLFDRLDDEIKYYRYSTNTHTLVRQ